MSVEIKWINHASFRLAADANVVYIDPWKLDFSPHDADVVFVSHSHHDHLSPEDIRKVSKGDTAVIAPAETVAKLHAANAVDPGQEITVKGVTVEAVAAYNVGKSFHPKANQWCGAVFTMGGQRVYYAGDTDRIPEMAGLAAIDVALLPVGGKYTLNAAEACQACGDIGCAAAIPYHWGDIIGSRRDAEEFAEGAGCHVHVLSPGQSVRIG
jgi:L-ascorbate metabolism protein UlaG (beta-lactamase superfamily)